MNQYKESVMIHNVFVDLLSEVYKAATDQDVSLVVDIEQGFRRVAENWGFDKNGFADIIIDASDRDEDA